MPVQIRLPVASGVVLLSLLGACRSKPPTPSAASLSPDVWALVDGREVRRDAVEKAYRRVVDPAASKPSDAEATTTKLALLNDLIAQDLLLAKAKALGVEATGVEIENAFNERRKSVSDEALQKQLSDRGLTVDDLKEDLRRELVTQKLLDREVNAKITVTDQAIGEYFNANRAQFNLAEPAYRVAQIVVTPERDSQVTNRKNDDATTAEAAARKAAMLGERLKSGASFSELAFDYSEDPQSAVQGGEIGLISASQLRQVDPALRDAVLKAQPGTISQVRSGGNYTLVLLISREPAGQRDLTSPGVRDGITSVLREQQQQMLQTAFVSMLRSDAQVVNLLAKQIVERHRAQAPPAVAPFKK